jgi:hypothetical protein
MLTVTLLIYYITFINLLKIYKGIDYKFQLRR